MSETATATDAWRNLPHPYSAKVHLAVALTAAIDALRLHRSMVCCGEDISPESEAAYNGAVEAAKTAIAAAQDEAR